MSTDPADVTIADLAAEQAEATTLDAPTNPPVEGPLYSRRDLFEVYALAVIVFNDDALGACGSDIMNALDSIGESCSPGTMYPILDNVLEAGLVTQKTLSRTKRYTIADAEAVDAELADHEQRLQWLLGVVRAARADLEE